MSIRPAVAFSLTFLIGSSTAAEAQEAVVRGRVRDTAGVAVPGVEVAAGGSALRATSDAEGRFVLRGLQAGRVTITARRIGFAGASLTVELRSGEERTLELTIRPEGVVLPDISTTARTAKPERYASTIKFDDFFRRQRSGFGTFITRDEIEKMNAFHTYEIIRNVPGVRVNSVSSDPLSARVTFSRCVGGRSNVVIFIDGARLMPQAVRSTTTDERESVGPARRIEQPLESITKTEQNRRGQGQSIAEMLARISAPQIEMVEVYRGTSEIPGELNEDACAVVFIWTRWAPARSQ